MEARKRKLKNKRKKNNWQKTMQPSDASEAKS